MCLLMLAGCGDRESDQDSQPGVVGNIVNEAAPDVREAAPPDNGIVTAEPAPDIGSDAQGEDRPGIMPAAVLGRWAGTGDSCTQPGADMELTIRPDALLFHESAGTVQAVERRPGGALSVTAAFTGEGESWTRTLELRPSEDGARLTIVNDGVSVTRKRC